uniref:SCP domain-containing protein n=1 Tax=Salix viminalis TaxID=40686 RepID=A0A6N2LW05_SALVM
MRWDNTVAAFARNYINGLAGSCRMVHSGGPYGENLAWGSPDLAGTAAVKMWVDERANYDYNSNSCVGGQCLHYTQVVWRNSVRLGCAKILGQVSSFLSCYQQKFQASRRPSYKEILTEISSRNNRGN